MPGVKGDIERSLGGADASAAGAKLGDGLGAGISSRSAAIAGAVGGVVATVAQSGIAAITNLVGEAVSASDATDKFKKTLGFAGLDTSAIDVATKKTRKYADDTVFDLSTIQNTTAQLAANGVPNYEKLTEAAGNLNAVAGGNNDTFSSVSMVLTQTAGAGKLTTENWNQLANAIPGASGVLIKALGDAGAYTGNFRDAMEKGEITSGEFNDALMKVGSQPIAVEAAKSTSTFEGAVGNLQASIVGGLSDALNGMKPVLTGFITGIAGFVGFIKDNISWIGPLAAGIGIVVGVITLWTIAQWLLNVALTANPIGLIVVGIGLLIGAIILLVQNWDTVVAFLGTVWNGFVTWFMGIMDAFLGWWNGLWTTVWEFIVGIWNGIVAGITFYINMVLLIISTVINTIIAVWNAVWGAIASFFVSIWDGIVSFVTTYINTVMAIIQAVGSAIAGVWSGIWDGIVSFFTNAWNNITGVLNTVGKAFGDAFSSVSGIVSGAFDGIVGVIRGAINGVIDLVNGAIGAINDTVGAAGAAFGVNIKIGKIPRLADGAIVSHGGGGIIANIGEGRYDEAVLPLSPEVLSALAGKGSGDRPIYMDGTLFGMLREMANGEAQIVINDAFDEQSREAFRGNNGL